jgi:hypothetical protein
MSHVILPMQAARFTAQHKIQNLYPHGFWVEQKLDGWRIQVHKTGDVIRLYSRSGKEYTDTFISIVDSIIKYKLLNVDNCILDGEILTWNVSRKKYGACSSLTTVAKATRDPLGARDYILVIRLWDVMQVNTDNLMELPLETRRKHLRAVVNTSDVLQVVPLIKFNGESMLYTWADATELLKMAMDRGEEGLVLKDPTSMYKSGRSVSAGWFKLKPDYLHNGTTEYDLLIVGARGGKGRSLNHFLVALAEDLLPGDDFPTRFRSVAHFTGMNTIEHRALVSILDGYMVPVKFSRKNGAISKNNTETVKFTRFKNTDRDFVQATWRATASLPEVKVVYSGKRNESCHWVFDPRFSVIVTIMADFRVIPTDTFAMKHTLRFSRIHQKGLRVHRPDLRVFGDEKPWWDCMPVSEWDKIVRASLDDTTAVGAAGSAGTCFVKISSKRHTDEPNKLHTQPHMKVFRAYNGGGGEHSKMLDNYVIHVQKCAPELLKELEECATYLGALVVAADPASGRVPNVYPGKTFIRIGTNTTSQAFVNCQRNDRDLVSSSWLLDCQAREAKDPSAQPLSLMPVYMLHTSTTLQEEFAGKFDVFGDSYTEHFHTQEELDNLLENEKVWDEMSLHSDGELSDDGMRELEEDLMLHSDGELSDDDMRELEEDRVIHSADGLHTNPTHHLAWSVFGGVVALMLPLGPHDEIVLMLARARLIAGGAIIATPDNHCFFSRVTHIVVVGNSVSPECNLLDTVRSKLPSPIPETTTPLDGSGNGKVWPRKRRHEQQEPAAKWVVVSEAWVKARSGGAGTTPRTTSRRLEDMMPLPVPLLVQP